MTTGSKRSQGWVMAWLLALWCCQLAWASDPVPIDFLPSGPFNLTRFQPFSGCDIYPYGDRDRARCGWFATVDWLTWWSRGPKQVIIGDPNGPLNTITGNDLSRQVNSLDTGWIGRANATGWRIDFGQAGRCGGWLCSVLNVNPFTDQYSVGQGEILFRNEFNDQFNSFRQAWIFETVRVKNKSRLQGVELMPFWRTDQLHHGGYLDWMAGVRYLKFDETFTVDAFDPRAWPGVTVGELVSDPETFVWTRAVNNIVGPQVALRWFQERGRWQASAEGRFTAGWNMQNITQTGILDLQSFIITIGEEQFVIASRQAITARHFNTFSPVAEARVNLAYQFTSHILGQVGWTGIWAANIARPNTMIDYGVPNFGILGRNKQDIFVQGLNIGVVFNR
jgi:hypothetical protein